MLTLQRLALGLLVAVALGTGAPARDEARVLAWGDQGDGTYRNPVLKADYSDPDVIRVGDDFYLVASDFHYVGIQVLHSRDLVNWEVVGQVFPRLDMHPKYDEMNGYAQGTWAPTLRHHDGRFYVYVCAPYDGLFMWHAEDPRGPWSETVTVKAVERWEDPAPFWDDDGKAYLVHSVLGAGPLILHRMSPDGRTLLDDGVEIYRGKVAEGPKLFKRGGDYYISLPEGGVERGGQTVLRARSLYGPWERRVVLPGGSPHQGGLVELPNGEAWFVGFKSTGHLGRVCHLLPVRWGDDGWPVFGAILVALGNQHAGLFSNNDGLANELLNAGLATGELVWRMPLGREYDKLIDSKFADMKNVGARNAGAITGAQFIQRFVEKDTPWAHLDVAGTAMGSPSSETNQSWGSGWGVRLLDEFVRARFERRRG